MNEGRAADYGLYGEAVTLFVILYKHSYINQMMNDVFMLKEVVLNSFQVCLAYKVRNFKSRISAASFWVKSCLGSYKLVSEPWFE